MKLYTEEQVKKAIDMARWKHIEQGEEVYSDSVDSIIDYLKKENNHIIDTNKKVSSIEWFMSAMCNSSGLEQPAIDEIYEQAKEMHKEEIISAVDSVELTNRYYYRSGGGFADDNAGKEIQLTGREYIGLSATGEQYYNTTFKSE